MAGGLFTRGEILEALEALTDELVGRGVAANIHIVGGSAVALLYDDEYVGTRDVDGALGRDRDAVKEAAAAVAVERGYPDDWLNDKAEMFVPPGGVRERTTIIERDGVSISVESAETLLAMKLKAGRPNRDFDHIETLIGVCGLTSLPEIEALYAEHYPTDLLKDQVHEWIRARYP